MPSMASHRYQQVASEIQKGLSQIIRDEMPLDRCGMITITRVQVSDGYESAKVYYTILGSKESSGEQMKNHTGKFTKLLQSKISLRKIPDLFFVYDETPEYVNRIEQLLEDHEKGVRK